MTPLTAFHARPRAAVRSAVVFPWPGPVRLALVAGLSLASWAAIIEGTRGLLALAHIA